ncbi:class I SAM-dependent methyltransferase [uncultured Jannaschia sp.]|uniref:class I SAM-dependent methyltransferase n=1 Tax=uncultured Jannaschia sp. TaxID=293347 RepID=UPI00261748C8|nr:class I SAM-dependent methyltransferase [uncultured Jannaschia sp.]
MNAAETGTAPRAAPVAAVRAYWQEHVTDWPIARAAPGTRDFFQQTEAYRFEKLAYLDRIAGYGDHAGEDVLDIGCGLGNDTARFAAAGARVTGLDIAPRALELSQENFAQRELEGRFVLGDGEALDFPEASFDFVYCHTVLHFTPHPERMVAEIHRVLRPGGRALLMMVNRRSWMRALHRAMKVEIDHLQSPVFHWYGPARFRAMLDRFDEVDLRFERFPVATKVHKGAKARIYNLAFVDLFNALPRRLTAPTGHHMLAFVRKAA